jgi:hypothetical protein
MTVHSMVLRSQRARRTLRRARLCLALVLVVLGALAARRATAQSREEPRVVHLMTTLEGQESSLTVSGPPDHGYYKVFNPGRTRAIVSVESLLLLGSDGNTRLAVTEVMANNRPVNAGSIPIPGHATVHLMVFFTGVPAGRVADQRFVVRLAARIDGEVQRGDSIVTRSRREPRRR